MRTIKVTFNLGSCKHKDTGETGIFYTNLTFNTDDSDYNMSDAIIHNQEDNKLYKVPNADSSIIIEDKKKKYTLQGNRKSFIEQIPIIFKILGDTVFDYFKHGLPVFFSEGK